ncbi:MAG: outer membrane protein transport protein, partial [Candidatus Cloacimonetes bacterium]|nr:outer membrane protein transport protein [Candidatus Cloacimonadota bacterium]
FQYSEESTGMGYGATFGILYQASEMVKLGFTLRTPTEVTMEGSADNDLMAAAFAAPAESDFDRDVTWPLWIGGGIALKLHEKFTLSLDAQYSRWSELDILKTEYKDSTWALVTGASGDDEFVLDWEDATQIRLGWEYQASPCFAVRGGYYYDPAPAPNETLNILFPSMTNSVITAGLGYCKGKIDIDFGIEYLFAIERSALASEHNMPGLHHMDVLAYSLGVGYKF